MYSLVACIVAGIIFIVVSRFLWEGDKLNSKLCMLCGILAIAGGSWAIPFDLGYMTTSNLRVEVASKTANILCLKDNFEFSGGTMFVGISQDMNYYYYTQDPDGAIALNNISVRSAKLYEDAPQGIGYILERWSIIPEANKTNKWIFYPGDRFIQQEIHVPPGTVLRQFLLDAE